MNPSTETSKRVLPIALLLGAAVAIPLLLQAGDEDPQLLEQRRREIEALSAADRDKLERQLETYREMSPERRAECKRLHNDLEEDTERGGNLRQVMQHYHDWLKTLSPWQREELRQAADTQTRLNLVRDFLRNEERDSPRSRGRWRPLYPISGPLADTPSLNSDDLASVSRALEAGEPLPEPLQERLANLEGPRRMLKFLAFRAKTPGRGPQNESWLNVDKAVDAISDEALRDRIDGLSDPEERRRFVSALLLKSLMVQWQDETQRVVPDENQLQEYYEKLDPGVRDELMQMSAHDFHAELRHRYMDERAPELSEIHDDLRTLAYRLWRDRRSSELFDPRRGSRRPSDEHRRGSGGRDGHRGHGPPKSHGDPPRDR